MIGSEVYRVITAADRWIKHGIPPIGGGGDDQAACFTAAADFVAGERARWRAELGLKD
jgi:hypothetical protein